MYSFAFQSLLGNSVWHSSVSLQGYNSTLKGQCRERYLEIGAQSTKLPFLLDRLISLA